jgi:hypothetical protein
MADLPSQDSTLGTLETDLERDAPRRDQTTHLDPNRLTLSLPCVSVCAPALSSTVARLLPDCDPSARPPQG